MAVDLFSGCGGLSLGFEQAGCCVRWANDIDQDAAATHRLNFSSTYFVSESIVSFLQRALDGEQGMPRPGEVDLVMGGPPCQGFSEFNRHRKPTDPRNSLMEVFLKFVDFVQPRFVLIENVPGLLSLGNGFMPPRLLGAFESMGYIVHLGILQAGGYGLPQNRWRVFVMAARPPDQLPEFPLPSHRFPRFPLWGATKYRQQTVRPPIEADLFCATGEAVTVGDAISDLPRIPNGSDEEPVSYRSEPVSAYQAMMRDGSDVVSSHVCARLGPINLERCKAVPRRKGAGWWDLPYELKPRNLLRHGDKRYENRFGRLHYTGHFNTILSKPEPYWSAVFHPTQNRLISVRESARAQGIPDWFQFVGKKGSRYAQVGNAVPPPLAHALAVQIQMAAGGMT